MGITVREEVTTSIMITMVDPREAIEIIKEMDLLAITITMDTTVQILNTKISVRCSVTNARTRVITPMTAQQRRRPKKLLSQILSIKDM